MTVETGKAGSHIEYWKNFSTYLVRHISSLVVENKSIVWLLWGEKAKSFSPYIKDPIFIDELYEGIPQERNYILTAPHPAASLYGGSKTFIGCNHFNKANELLRLNHKKTIYW